MPHVRPTDLGLRPCNLSGWVGMATTAAARERSVVSAAGRRSNIVEGDENVQRVMRKGGGGGEPSVFCIEGAID